MKHFQIAFLLSITPLLLEVSSAKAGCGFGDPFCDPRKWTCPPGGCGRPSPSKFGDPPSSPTPTPAPKPYRPQPSPPSPSYTSPPVSNPPYTPPRTGRICNTRSNLAYVAEGIFLGGGLGYRSTGWYEVRPGACFNVSQNAYTYISYDNYTGYGTPPRQYRSRPQLKLCVMGFPFDLRNAEDFYKCAQSGGRMETFLLYGPDDQTLDYKPPG